METCSLKTLCVVKKKITKNTGLFFALVLSDNRESHPKKPQLTKASTELGPGNHVAVSKDPVPA